MSKEDDITITLSKEQAEFVLESIKSLPDSKKNVSIEMLQKSIEKICTIWRRRAKNAKIAEQARVARAAKPQFMVKRESDE
jgi:hypothetical protein